MVHHRVRQVIYLVAFLALLAGVGTILYSYRAQPPAPTCSDNIKNGTEEGPDCGGSCIPCAEKYPQPLRTSVLKTRIVNGLMEVLGKAENGNDVMSAYDFQYVFDFKDSSGKIITTRSGYYSLAPHAASLFVENGVDAANSAVVDFKATDVNWIKTTQVLAPTFRIDMGKFFVPQKGEFGAFEADGVLVNNSLEHVDTVDVVVVLYDAQSQIVEFSRTQLHNVGPFEQRAFRVIWQMAPGGTVARAEGSATVDIRSYIPGAN